MPKLNSHSQAHKLRQTKETQDEAVLLGCVVLDGTRWREIARLRDFDFISPGNRAVFAAMRKLTEENTPIHEIALKTYFQNSARAAQYISTLLEYGDPTPGGFAAVLTRVRNHVTLRRARSQFGDIEHQLLDGKEIDIQTVLRATEGVARDLRSIQSPGCNADFFDTPEQIKNAPPLRFAIDGFLQCEVATVIAGLASHYKTFVMLSLMKALLDDSIQKLWGHFDVKEKSTRVIYLVPESARGPLGHRLRLMGLLPFVEEKRLLIRTLNMGPAPSLQDPRLLEVAEGADIFLDTAVRFMSGDENSASDSARGLSADLFAVLGSSSRMIVAAAHSPKNFEKENHMSLEGMVRGSSDIGTAFATGWGVRFLENIGVIHVENIKPRDFAPCGPFQLMARPYLDDCGDFRMWREPGSCEPLERIFQPRRGGGAPREEREAKKNALEIVRQLEIDRPGLSNQAVADELAKSGHKISPSAASRYRKTIRDEKQPSLD